MPEIGTSGSMSGDRKRSVGHRPQATAPILDSAEAMATRYGDRFPGAPVAAGHAARQREMTVQRR
jgi:hypothetical protein